MILLGFSSILTAFFFVMSSSSCYFLSSPSVLPLLLRLPSGSTEAHKVAFLTPADLGLDRSPWSGSFIFHPLFRATGSHQPGAAQRSVAWPGQVREKFSTPSPPSLPSPPPPIHHTHTHRGHQYVFRGRRGALKWLSAIINSDIELAQALCIQSSPGVRRGKKEEKIAFRRFTK